MRGVDKSDRGTDRPRKYKAIDMAKNLMLSSYRKVTSPVVIVAGGCDVNDECQVEDYRRLLLEAFRGFKGTIICGGTTAGISGVVGNIGTEYRDAIRTIGYIPRAMPEGASIDKRYSEIRYTEGNDFSALEPLQYWSDIIASGISPSQVKLLGINGGAITATEYRIALALGAYVAVIKDNESEAEKLLMDDDWSTLKMLLPLPADVMTIKAFIGWGSSTLTPDTREVIAKAIHNHYRYIRRSDAPSQEPSTVPWGKLPHHLKESNRQQAEHNFEKLRQIGYTVHKITDRDITLMVFPEDEVGIMAEMEHGRWNIERLLDGWRWGEIRDVMKKTSPYLVPWSELPDDIKERDRELMQKIPEFLAKVGLEIHR
jgi:hypothetical protein